MAIAEDPFAKKRRVALRMAIGGVVWSAVACAIGVAALSQGVDAGLVAVLAFPLCLALVTWWALHRWCATSSRSARAVAWAAVVVLAAFSMVTGFSIGLLFLPPVILLGGATVITRGMDAP